MDRRDGFLPRFGQRITYLREQQGLSIPELASRSGLTERMLVRVEAGELDIIFTDLLLLAKGLGLDPHELLETL